MKYVTWIIAFLITAIVNTIIKDLDIAYSLATLISPDNADEMTLLAGLFSGLFAATTYSCAFYFARKINKRRETVKKQKSKEASTAFSSESEQTDTVTSTIERPLKVKSAKVPSKQRYCRFCGGMIDTKSKKCTKCRKQYFRITKNSIIVCCMCGTILLLVGSIGMNIYQHMKNNADSQPAEVPETNITVDPVESALAERAAYILDYYDARIDNLNKNLNFKSSYFTPIDIDSLSADSVDDRYILWLIEKYGYLPDNEYGAEKGKKVGDSITAWVADFDRQFETFRDFSSDYAGISKEEARKFFIDMEMWCGSFQVAADSITSTLDAYDTVLDNSWHARIDTILEELLKVQREMLAISEEIYKAKQ